MAVFLMETKRNGKNGNGAVYQVTQIKGSLRAASSRNGRER